MPNIWITLPSLLLATSATAQVVPQSVDTASGTAVEEADTSSHSDIDYDRSDRMTLPVTVNGNSQAQFLIDTGSERTILSNELASSLALPQLGNVIISGTAGKAVAPTAKIHSLNFTDTHVTDLEAPLLHARNLGADGLIGLDSLEKKVVIFDFVQHKMEIRTAKRRSFRPTSSGDEIVVVGRKREGRMVITNASVDGIPVTVVIDSGAQYSIGNPALLQRLKKKRKIDNIVLGVLHSVTGQNVVAEVAKVRTLEIGSMTLGDAPIAFTDSPAFHTLNLAEKPALLLGMNSLRAFSRVEVDFASKKVRFTIPGETAYQRPQRYASR